MAEGKENYPPRRVEGEPVSSLEASAIHQGPVSEAILALAGLIARQVASEDFEAARRTAMLERRVDPERDTRSPGEK